MKWGGVPALAPFRDGWAWGVTPRSLQKRDWKVTTTNKKFSRFELGTSAAAVALAMVVGSAPAYAQDAPAADDASNDVIIVTGSRIARPNFEATSPIQMVTSEQLTARADVTLDTFLNTLPQANPAGTSTSNNPGNGGQSNINLRGLGSNRNLVLIDGRRPMVSASDQSVDLNTIPQGLIDRIDVITGGAGATYGADAIAGVVNIRLKDNFEGLDLRATYSNAMPKTDAREYQFSGVLGGNFAEGRGNIAVSFEYAKRQGLIKAQRGFAAQATSTTGTPPVGRLVEAAANGISQAAINALFASYGVSAAQAPIAGLSQMHFNSDGSLFGGGIFNSPLDVSNYRYAASGNDAAAANQNFFPDFYSYNFDAINLLVLPLKRKSAFLTGHYEISDAVEFFTQGGYTEYTSSTALAPTPIGTRIYNPATPHASIYATSSLITPGTFVTNSIVPVTNPFIPAALRTLLATRTGNDASLVGAGATEPIRMSIRSLSTGLRLQTLENKVFQGLAGLRGEIAEGWRYEAYYSYGKTTITSAASGNVNVQNLQTLLEAADGGASICAGGYNPFGIQPVSAECVEYLNETGITKQEFTQKVAQAYIQGDLVELPAGTLSLVAGVEQRKFRYSFDPGALSGPIAGFNTSTPDLGTNKFTDFFGELLVPLLKDAPFAESLDLGLGYRHSKSDFNDIANGINGSAVNSEAYKAELTWAPVRNLKLRATYSRSVRAPNFGELFSGGSSFVQAFDPCSVTTNYRQTGGAAARQLCINTGVAQSGVDAFVATPGLQVALGVAGNPNLKPEKADTITAGFTYQTGRFAASIDYYNIKIKKPVFNPDTNLYIAACYGYVGNFDQATRNLYCGLNPNNTPNGSGIIRAGSQFSFVAVPSVLGGDSNSNFTAINSGQIKTSGIDIQASYNLPTDFAANESSLNFALYANYLIDYKVQELPGVTLDYAGTVSYFGAGLGTSFPEWKANLDIAWKLKPITLSTRIRYIDGMKNRGLVQFPGEASTFTSAKSITYFDFAAQANIENYVLRVGVNNAFDKKPPQYRPNVQSGTDPSLYDVIGRRAYVQVQLKF